MRVRAAQLLLALLAFAHVSCDELVPSVKTSRASTTTATPNESSGPPPPDPEQLQRERAIELAKQGRNLMAGRVYTKLPPAEMLTNDYQIRAEMMQVKGELNVHGWRARKWEDDTYLVTYSFERRGETKGWPFEVKVSAGVVRYILGDPELEEKYGWGMRTPGSQ